MSDTNEPLAAIIAEMKRENRPYGISPDRLRSYADRIERANVRALALLAEERAKLETKAESEKRWANDYFDLARRREDALVHCRQYAQKIERENDEGETRLDAEEIIATVDNEFDGIRPKFAPGDAAALREALEKLTDAVRNYFGWDDAPAVQDRDDPTAYFCAEMSAALAALAAPARNADRFETHNEAKAAFLHSYFGPTEPEFVEDAFARWLFAPEGGSK